MHLHSEYTPKAETNFECCGLQFHSVNFAFAYIDPSSLQIITMDSSTPSSLFQEVGNLKSVKQDLSVFISVGGW
jgi:GH18 family chitinase